MVVRFEVDACLSPKDPGSKATKKRRDVVDGDLEDDLLGALSGLSIGTNTRSSGVLPPSPLTTTELKISRAGTQVPQSNLIEMTARSEASAARFDWSEAYPQLYLSQTPYHYLAVHRGGTFFSLAKREIGKQDLVAIERRAQLGFKRLRKVLGEIQTRVKKGGTNGRISIVCKNGVLKVHERTSKESCLPDDSLALFERKQV
jgi:hypothetical protein